MNQANEDRIAGKAIEHAPRPMAFFDVSFALVKEMLLLPEGTTIDRIADSEYPGCLRVFVNHPDLPPVLWGATIPRISPSYTAEYEVLELADGTTREIRRVDFQEW